MLPCLDAHEHGDPDVELGSVEQGDPAADDPRLLEVLDAPPAGRGREPGAFGDLRYRQGRVLLQAVEYLPVDTVHRATNPTNLKISGKIFYGLICC